MNNPKITMIPTIDLEFDPQNPRFYRLNDPATGIVEEMLDNEGIQDLMNSIGQKGYFPGEPLLVVANNAGKYLVVEGNRRLAATKLLNEEFLPPTRRRNSIQQIISEAVVSPPKELPCIVYGARKEILRYLGYRHITGIKEWDALSKARYLADIRGQFYSNLSQVDQMRSIARDIGSRSDYVAQLLASLGLYIRAEEKKFFDLPMKAEDVEFSYISTAIGYKKIADWLGLESKSDIEMPNLNMSNLKRFFSWLFPKDQQGRTIIGESRNLDKLADVVSCAEAVKVLEDTGRLKEAYLFSEGPQQALVKAMDSAQERLQQVWTMLPNTSPLTPNHLEQSKKIAEDARAIRNYLVDKMEGN